MSTRFQILLLGAFTACGSCSPNPVGIGQRGQCSADTECAPICDWTYVQPLLAPGYAPTFVSTDCALGAVEPNPLEPMCDCTNEGSGMTVLWRGDGTLCLALSRDNLTCLYSQAEFPGCDLASPATSCNAPCSDFQSRVSADASRILAASILGAFCRNYFCRCVIDIEGHCYVNGDSFVNGYPRSYDCSLGASQILSLYEAAH